MNNKMMRISFLVTTILGASSVLAIFQLQLLLLLPVVSAVRFANNVNDVDGDNIGIGIGIGGMMDHRRPHLHPASLKLRRALSLSLQQLSPDGEGDDGDDSDVVIPPCNSVLATFSADELRATANALISTIVTDTESFESLYLQSILINNIQYGIQVHRVCAGCEDVNPSPDGEAAQVFDSFCGPENYGATNATFSGLMMVPMINDTTVLPGTLPVVIDMHPTVTASVPSLSSWTSSSSSSSANQGGQDSESGEENLLLQLDAVLTATGQVLVFPDYMGYAENSKELYKGYTIKKAYETSSVPIVLWAQRYIRELTDCATEMSTSVVGIKGYSEGGYTALVLADVLHRMGWNIVQVMAGGGPYDVIAATTKTYERIINGQYDMRRRHIMALVGVSYSSTYRDLPNYNVQNMLRDEIRPTLVDLITSSAPEPVVREAMPFVEQTDILDLLFDEEYQDFFNASVSVGLLDPCGSSAQESLIEMNVDLICEAFQLNMVTEMLQNAPYPVEVCHSPDDEVVPIESVPDLSGNENIRFTAAEGNHNEAGAACIFNAMLYFLNPAFQSMSVEAVHSIGGCNAASNDQGSTQSPSPAPIGAAEDQGPAQSPSPVPMDASGPTPMVTNEPTMGRIASSSNEPPTDSSTSSTIITFLTSATIVAVVTSTLFFM